MELKAFKMDDQTVDMDARTFEGYASTFGNMDQVGDIIERGAFTKSIAERFGTGQIKVLWQHDQPLGMPVEMREDDRGLWVKGRVSKTRLGDEALELMRDGVIDRMSIGFSIPKGKSDIDGDGIRRIREVKLYEFSPVTFPANEAAVITGVKSLQERLRAAGLRDDRLDAVFDQLEKALQALQAGDQPDPKGTTGQEQEPPELKELFSSISDLGDFARHTLY